jgi:hypothetical protein
MQWRARTVPPDRGTGRNQTSRDRSTSTSPADVLGNKNRVVPTVIVPTTGVIAWVAVVGRERRRSNSPSKQLTLSLRLSDLL